MQLGYRFSHILRRMLPIAMYLLQRDGQFLNGHDLFLKRVGATYHAFLEDAERSCRSKCLEDLQSTTRYVTWSLHTKSRASLKSMLSRVRAFPSFRSCAMLCLLTGAVGPVILGVQDSARQEPRVLSRVRAILTFASGPALFLGCDVVRARLSVPFEGAARQGLHIASHLRACLACCMGGSGSLGRPHERMLAASVEAAGWRWSGGVPSNAQALTAQSEGISR
jgi:hypothetical protein